MKVFISWSGPRSKGVAQALYDWLPNVIQAVSPWISGENIDKGINWDLTLDRELNQSSFGILCLTPENLSSPWLHYEAGKLSKALDSARVCPYLLDLKPSDVKLPLARFQATVGNREDTKKLVNTINHAFGDEALPEGRVNQAFERYWPDLEQCLKNIPPPIEEIIVKRSDRDLLEEIVEAVRKIRSKVAPGWEEWIELSSSKEAQLFEYSQSIANMLLKNKKNLKKGWKELWNDLAGKQMRITEHEVKALMGNLSKKEPASKKVAKGPARRESSQRRRTRAKAR